MAKKALATCNNASSHYLTYGHPEIIEIMVSTKVEGI